MIGHFCDTAQVKVYLVRTLRLWHTAYNIMLANARIDRRRKSGFRCMVLIRFLSVWHSRLIYSLIRTSKDHLTGTRTVYGKLHNDLTF